MAPVAAAMVSPRSRTQDPFRRVTGMALSALALVALASARAEAAVSTWIATGPTGAFSDVRNWDVPPTPGCDLVFTAGTGDRRILVNDLIGLDVDTVTIDESCTITGNPVTCRSITTTGAAGPASSRRVQVTVTYAALGARRTPGERVIGHAGRTVFGSVVGPRDVDVTPPVISGIDAGGITASSAVVTWSTDEASDSEVAYGLTSGYGSLASTDASLVLSHSVPITGLQAGITYHYQVRSTDAAMNPASSSDQTFTTAAADLSVPVISAIAWSSPSPSSTIITWSTNEVSDSLVEYGLNTLYGSMTPLDSNLVTSHSVLIPGLAVNASYHFRVSSADAAGNRGTSSDRIFISGASGGDAAQGGSSGSVRGSCGAGGAFGLLVMGLLLPLWLRPSRRANPD